MTYEQALAKQAAAGYGALDVRRDRLRPGGWATRSAAKLHASRRKYEGTERGEFMRHTYELDARYLLNLRRRLAGYPGLFNDLRDEAIQADTPAADLPPECPPADTATLARQHQETLHWLNNRRAWLQSPEGRATIAKLEGRGQQSVSTTA